MNISRRISDLERAARAAARRPSEMNLRASKRPNFAKIERELRKIAESAGRDPDAAMIALESEFRHMKKRHQTAG